MKELLFSVTAKDCRFDYYKGSGKGGQKRNKTSSAVRCTHLDSGAVGQSDDTRSQHSNKIMAFSRMAETKEFKAWHTLEVSKKLGILDRINDYVDKEMNSQNICVEFKTNGLWVKQEKLQGVG